MFNQIADDPLRISEDERDAWIETIADLVSEAYQAALTDRSKFRRIRYIGRKIYNHRITQQAVGLMIFGNFLTSCFDAQIQPEDGSELSKRFQQMEIAFAIIFSLELASNMFLYWFWLVTLPGLLFLQVNTIVCNRCLRNAGPSGLAPTGIGMFLTASVRMNLT